MSNKDIYIIDIAECRTQAIGQVFLTECHSIVQSLFEYSQHGLNNVLCSTVVKVDYIYIVNTGQIMARLILHQLYLNLLQNNDMFLFCNWN